ncbi:STAS domain-containing protein [Candidatus Formimonas warabiya]|uniref:Anti-sigma factor antagonist n=1 Tax=Formimonas warabiya TaxID=1761012 RepID=A0A3G1KZK9_FORW1|nr:STAS domain-containing protein [Candidatus Formimonas warabiya]ATW27850.1 hypothetical protein DCMF_26610 [Candidatus Formimonas warabiya]
MKIAVNKEGKLLIVMPEGRIDAYEAKNLQSTIEQEITPDIASVVFDLKGVSYISSAGLRVMMVVSKRMRQVQGSVALCHVGQFCRDVMDTAGFLEFLPLFDRLEQAVAYGRQSIQEKEYLENWAKLEVIDLCGGKATIIPGSGDKGEALVTGDIKAYYIPGFPKKGSFPRLSPKLNILSV